MRIFVTHILTKENILKYKLSVAASNFCWNLIEGGVFDKVFSILPTNVHDSINKELMEGLAYCQLRRLGGAFRFLAVIVENLTVFKAIPSGSKVWFYNLTVLNSFLYILLRVFKRTTKIYVILLDYTPSSNYIQKFFLWQANHADGIIKLSNSVLFTNENSVCLPGVTPIVVTPFPRQEKIKKEFLLSGVLNERIAMTEMVLEVFSCMEDYVLHVTGEIQNEDLVGKYSSFKNIIIHGQLSYDDYISVLHKISFQLSTRDPKYPENQCNFPSKVIEALLHNRIVVSTIQYEQLENIYYFYVPSDMNGFKQTIINICSLQETEIMKYANQGSIVNNKFNTEAWNDAMSKIESVR